MQTCVAMADGETGTVTHTGPRHRVVAEKLTLGYVDGGPMGRPWQVLKKKRAQKDDKDAHGLLLSQREVSSHQQVPPCTQLLFSSSLFTLQAKRTPSPLSKPLPGSSPPPDASPPQL